MGSLERRKLALARFDFSEMTKRSLGQHWKSLNPGEQKQFVDAFTQWQLISWQIVRSARGDEVQFTRELEDGKDVSVETKVVRRYSKDLPIDYWLHNVNGQWKVFNMVIDHVDIVKNVNAQFERVIAKSSLQELLQKVKIRTQVNDAEPTIRGLDVRCFEDGALDKL